MLLLSLLSLQTADPTVDVNRRILPDWCRAATVREDDVVVCGRSGERSPYRIGPQGATPPALPQAEFKLSDGVGLGLNAEQGEVGGIPTNRAMVTLKIKF